jgi:hypothetical protein
LSATTAKLRLACWAQTWAALRTTFCQVAAEPKRALKAAWRLLALPPRLVPSGMKLMVTSCAAGQALPDAE